MIEFTQNSKRLLNLCWLNFELNMRLLLVSAIQMYAPFQVTVVRAGVRDPLGKVEIRRNGLWFVRANLNIEVLFRARFPNSKQ